MKHALTLVLMALLAVPATVTPADAGKARVSLHHPRMIDQDTARLKGRVNARETVRIQRYAPARHRWVRVKRVRANTRGVFRANVRATERRVRYRAVTGKARSRSRVVQAPTPAIDAEPAPQPAHEPAPSDACGVQPVKAGGGHWECALAEEFSGTTLDRSVWTPQTTGYATGSPEAWACYIDDPSVISVHDGALHLTARKLPQSRPCLARQGEPTQYVAGMVSTYRLFSQQYGRFEARFKNTATTAPGLHEAFWLWPDERYSTRDWPASGEIDIAETYSKHSDLAIPFLHYTADDNGGPKPGLNTAWNCHAKRGTYNTYTLEWTAQRLEILVNGKTCLVNTSGDPAFKKRYIVALTQALGAGGNAYDGRAPLPATMTVDYVRVWK